MSKRTSAKAHGSAGNQIDQYPKGMPAALAEVCHILRREIDGALPKAESKVWHSMPVWFIDGNPVVGYKLTARKSINLLFWNGQAFDEPALKPAGKFMAAQIQFTNAKEIERTLLRRWLKKAGKDIWDYLGLCG